MSTFPVELRGAKASTLMWAEEWEVEAQALQQLRNIAALPWVHGLRVMPDVHFGIGATVGSVIAMENALAPSAVGVDIGCGVSGVKTNLTWEDLPDDLGPLRSKVEAAIPVGFHSHDHDVKVEQLGLPKSEWDKLWVGFESLRADMRAREGRARAQMGSLGGGNHFLEICSDQEGFLWLTLHSGSRNIGKELAERHITIAKGLPHNQDLPDKDLAVFFAHTPEMKSYRYDLTWAQEYAARSRLVMMALFKQTFRETFSQQVKFTAQINVHHNYVAEEEIDGRPMLVTRKGAIRAGLGEMALIPGSMGTGSYVVRGLGNPASFQSASHGAGRRMSRGAAKRAFTVDDLAAQTRGIECRKDAAVIDEIPSAYKNIDSVIEAQADLVEVVARLQTLLCVKG